MPRPRLRAALVALLILTGALAGTFAPSRAGAMMDVPLAQEPQLSAVAIGIADQKPDMFVDPRFVSLGITHARLAVGWDVLTNRASAAELEAWLGRAREAGVQPLISFMHSRGRNRRALPSPLRLRREFRRLRELYPWVTTYATWNEANHCGEPLCHRPKTAAAYYRVLRRECPSCTILAPEMLDMPGMGRWVRQFSRWLGFTPRLWGLHNYVEANRFRTVRLRELLSATHGAEIWLTETGGLVRRDNNSTTDIPEGVRHAGDVTRFIFDEIVPRYPLITRVYIYHWNSSSRKDTWDSALIAPGGRERSALFVLSRVVRDGPRPLGSFRATPSR
ncbi:MAG: hypothetical protein QOI64_2556 [Solirubrobacteraceae bacterium]|nr:hypothetical protein [Solirubrobacteraceae bacterium]